MSVISGTLAATGQRKSAKEQNALTAQQNQDMLLLELAARGAPLDGSSVPESMRGTQSAILPYYFGGQEKQMSDDASALYRTLQSRLQPPDVQLAKYDELLGKYEGAIGQNEQLARDLASGRLTDKSIAESQPVFGARRGVAEAKTNAGLEALRETLNEIDAIQSGKGYSGDSTGKRMMRFNARRQIGTQSAADFSNVDLENALEKRALQSEGRGMQLANMNLPDAMAKAAINRTRLPSQAATAAQMDTLAPFDFFKLNPANFSQPNPLNPMPDTRGAIANSVAQAGATIGGSLANYYQNRNLANQGRQQFNTTEGSTAGWGYLRGGGGGGGDAYDFDGANAAASNGGWDY